ncbi:hypothetical protein K493DRAFT_298135 [Basidiobolus meristosporus CBS 931.73]|uniref:Uncharacterized protein n=1 Tax=Basidiobolus meristosporus CBS 931.73 TaxID=1314790 RepID=A0A1Y1YWJ0_9FUNG|nr:hypothetical protein K493DRAFT_298135 [Basidiobolus meristosporus CBS 931.73]|eukprot:ORY01935.1 hypothetical protein K493DRAFT_298135 [Basidiobolus meristosporus CBS 931.73]
MSSPALTTAPVDDQLIPPRTSSMVGTGILEVDDEGNLVTPRPVRGVSMVSTSHPTPTENNASSLNDSTNDSSHQPAIPVGILSRHILQKKHLRQQFLLHIAAEILITTGHELDTYLTLIRTYARADNEEYEYDPLHLVPPPPTYAIAKEQPPAYFVPPTNDQTQRASSITRPNELSLSHRLRASIISIDNTTVGMSQVVNRTNSIAEHGPTTTDFRPPSYRSTESGVGRSSESNMVITLERDERIVL